MVLWLKALHIIGVIAWMAGMLYLPQLFVYHVDAPTGSVESETFKVMERRLLRGILNPSCLVVFVTGPVLGYMTGYWQSPWLQIKIAPVLALAILHAYFAVFVRAFARDENYHSARFFRIINEAPALLMVAIVILAAVKPF